MPGALDRQRAKRSCSACRSPRGTPANIIDKIVEGKLKKFASERALLEQLFIKDDTKNVGQLVAAVSGARVVRFARFKVGEA